MLGSISSLLTMIYLQLCRINSKLSKVERHVIKEAEQKEDDENDFFNLKEYESKRDKRKAY